MDLREGSPTFLSYEALVLSESNHLSFLIPEGFAHGFQTLEPNCEMIYFHSADYEPQSEGAINAQDPRIGISWPELISERSQKDSIIPSCLKISKDFKNYEMSLLPEKTCN